MLDKLVFDFVGTSGCGKTTIMKDMLPIIKEMGYSVNIVESSSRTLLKKFDLKLYDKTGDFVQSFISLINWGAVFKSILEYDVTLCTDLGVRSLVYTQFSQQNSNEIISAHRWVVEFFKSHLFHARVKPCWVYLPLEIEMDVNENDEHRGFVDLRAHKRICKLTEYTLQTLSVPYYVLTGTKEERIDKMKGLTTRMVDAMRLNHMKGGRIL